MNLEKNLTDNILECEIKLGHAAVPISFYYPISSLSELLDCNESEIDPAINDFREAQADRLGRVTIRRMPNEERYEVTVMPEGVNWVHNNFKPTEFMKEFVTEIKRPGNTIDDMIKMFKRYSDKVDVKLVGEDEWALSFDDDEVDPYVYHIEKNNFGLEYHRFTKESYMKL